MATVSTHIDAVIPGRVLVVAPQPFFSPRGTPFSVYYRTLVLAEQGARVDLLTYGQGADVDLPDTRIVRIPNLSFLGAVPIGPSWKKLFLDVFMILWTIALLLRGRYRIVHAHEEAVFWCRFLQPLFGFRLIYDMHSSLPQQLDNFRFTRSRWLVRIFRALEDTCLRAADAVIVICPDLRDYVLSVGVPRDRLFLIENSIFDDVRVKSRGEDVSAGADPLSLIDTSRPVVLYAGTFEPYQGIDVLVRAFAIVQRECPEAQLLLLGGMPQQVERMRALARELGVDCRFTGRVSKTVAMRCTRAASVLVSPRRHGTNTPLKIYEQLASGKPLVATRIWSHTQVLSDDVCMLVEPEPEAMARGILRVIREPQLALELAERARELYSREYARGAYVGKMRRMLELLT